MKTLHLYLTRQVLATLLMTVAVFTFVLLLGNVLKEILNLLVNRQVTLLVVLEAVGLLIPFVLVFALPMGFLTATLLVFGRFSADNELTAARASGISLLSLATPILLLSVLMSCVSAVINLHIGPASRVAYKKLLADQGLVQFERIIPERTFIKDVPGCIMYFGKVSGTNVRDVLIYKLDKAGERVEQSYRAPRGTIVMNVPQRKVHVQMFSMSVFGTQQGQTGSGDYEETLELGKRTKDEPSLTDLTFSELQAKKEELESKGIPATPVEVVMNSKVSFSFACIAFTLVGIPLGIRAHRRETTVGMAVGLVLVLIYYAFIFLGQALQTKPQFAPNLIVWLPNFLFEIAGAWLLWRANKGV